MTTSITLRAAKGSPLTHNEVDANFTNLQVTADAAASDAAQGLSDKANASAVGITSGASDMGTFTGTTITDNVTAKVALQELETAVESTSGSAATKANASAVGISAAASNMGTYTGATIPDNETAKQNLQSLETACELLSKPETYGAVGDGATNDSAAFTSAFSAKRNVICSSGKTYSVKDIALSHSQSVNGDNTIFTAATSATNLMVLSDTDPRVSDFRVSSGTSASAALFRVKASRGARITDISAVNTGYGVVNLSPVTAATDIIALPVLSNIQAEQVSNTAFFIGQNVSEMRANSLHAHGNLQAGTGGDNPASGTIGWRQSQALSGSIARGGHQVSRANMLVFETGWYFTDVELLMYNNIYADSCSGFGIVFDGTGNGSGIQLSDVFIGTTRGYKGAGNSDVSINGLTTIFNGTIPPWGGSDFYTGTAYDVTLESTAKLTISGYWRGDKKLNIASTAKLILNCGDKYKGRSIGTVGAGATGYMYEGGTTATEGDAIWRAPVSGKVVGITVYTTAAPGDGQTFTYTLRKNFAGSAFVVTLSGAGAFGGDNWYSGGISLASGDSFGLQLVTSAGAAAARHSAIIHFVPD